MKCPICHNICNTFIDEKQSIEHNKCYKCQYVFKSPVHHADMEKQKKRYDLHENDPGDPGYRAYFQRFLDFVLPLASVHGAVLDFGSGESDLLASMLQSIGYDMDRYDPIYHPDESYRNRKFDLIVSTEVFEHLDDPLGVIGHLSELLNLDGYLAIQTQFCPQDNETFLNWYYRLDPTHIGFFTPDTFRHMAQAVGLKYITDDGINKVIFQK